MTSIINGQVPHSQANQAISNFQQSAELCDELFPYLHRLDPINSLLLEHTALINENESRGATIDDYREYSGMSNPALQARVRKLRDELPEGQDICFLRYEPQGLKYLHYSRIPYSLLKQHNEKFGIDFDQYLGKYVSKNNKHETSSEEWEKKEKPIDFQSAPTSNRNIQEISQDDYVPNADVETIQNEESTLLFNDEYHQSSSKAVDEIKEFSTSSNSIDLEKTVAVILAQIVKLNKEIAQLRQENQSFREKILEQQNNLASLEQQIKEGTNKKIAEALDQLLTFNQGTQ